LRQLEAEGIRHVSSQQLASHFHLSSTQIRKDLAQFGEFGVRGIGYDVERLADHLAGLLHLDRVHPLIIVGMGNVGTALARFPPFNSGPFRVVAGFDSDSQKVGRRVGSVAIHDLSELCDVIAGTGATMAILAVPAGAAPLVHRSLVECGIRSILNFAPVTLSPLPECRVKNVDLRIHLEELAFFLASGRVFEAGV
jgi:redox-sensing transcriptional repressor